MSSLFPDMPQPVVQPQGDLTSLSDRVEKMAGWINQQRGKE